MYHNLIVNSPDGTSGGGSSEPTVEQLQQQLRETQAKYEALNQKVEKGELVDPVAFVKAKVEAGELFPKERFTGLQQTFQAEQENRKKLQDTLTALTASDMELKKQFSNLENEKTDLMAKLDEKMLEVETLTRKAQRANLIMEKFPELAPFESKGLLPEGEEAELEQLFGAFASQLGSIREDATKAFVQGGSKVTPHSKKDTEPPAPQGAQAYLKLANQALASGDIPGYNKNYDLYLDAMKKKDAVR